MASRIIRVVELFAGVGGFRLGLESASSDKTDVRFEVVWSNQWEPSTKTQHASDIYVRRFGKANHSNLNIEEVSTDEIPDHDILVGGFPCQDYSVASTLKNSKGLLGKKGVLWWQIHRILNEKKRKPSLLILENVDRLLSSPAKQRGKDMAVMLRSLSDLGYAVEWRVLNAAEFGMPQRRRRVFLVGYLRNGSVTRPNKDDALKEGNSILNNAFPCDVSKIDEWKLDKNIGRISRSFNKAGGKSPFKNAGYMMDDTVVTGHASYAKPCKTIALGDILLDEKQVPEAFFIPREQLPKWKYLKGAKKESRRNRSTGHTYTYSEGAMSFPDDPEKPSRTVITGEGGSSPSRFKHVVQTRSGRFRRLTPVELERLNMFPDGHTEGASDTKRAFFMGNALVVGIVEKIGAEVLKNWNEQCDDG